MFFELQAITINSMLPSLVSSSRNLSLLQQPTSRPLRARPHHFLKSPADFANRFFSHLPSFRAPTPPSSSLCSRPTFPQTFDSPASPPPHSLPFPSLNHIHSLHPPAHHLLRAPSFSPYSFPSSSTSAPTSARFSLHPAPVSCKITPLSQTPSHCIPFMLLHVLNTSNTRFHPFAQKYRPWLRSFPSHETVF